MKILKYQKLILLAFLSIFLFTINCDALVEKENYVTDQANLLKKDTKAYLLEASNYLENNLDIEYYVVTINNLDNLSIEEYTNELYKEFKIDNNGILILISKEDREVRVKVGTELSEVITNNDIKKILDEYTVPFLINNDWDIGVKNGYSAFYKIICNYYGIDSDSIEVKDGNDFIVKYKYYLILLIIWITTIISYVLCAYFKRQFKKNYRNNNIMDTIIFSLSVFLNILLLSFSYYIMPLSILLVLAYEIVIIIGSYNTPIKKRKKRRKRKKK